MASPSAAQRSTGSDATPTTQVAQPLNQVARPQLAPRVGGGEAAKILDHFESMFICMRRASSPRKELTKSSDFWRTRFFIQAEEVSSYARLAMHALRMFRVGERRFGP